MAEPFGRYQLLKRIAGGGMGEVFLARQGGIEGFEKLLVIKTLLPHVSENTEFVQMFLDEARLAARLAHPNCISIFDLGQEQGIFYIAMEYVHGEDLKRLWKQAYVMNEVIPLGIACRIVADSAAGLGYAHRLADSDGKPIGLVHRDVSPQNVLVTFDGGVKLIDFGVAKAAGRATHTQTGALKGKYAYMSPEQVDGQEIDQRSDVFALGIVLWEMVTGRRLFRNDTDVQTLKAVLKCEVEPPSALNPAIPPDLDPVILKALARDRNVRYPSMEAFRLDLEEWIARQREASSNAHLSAFMQKLFAERLRQEGTKGALADVDPNATGFSPFGRSQSGVTNRPRGTGTSPASSASNSMVVGANPLPFAPTQTALPPTAGSGRNVALGLGVGLGVVLLGGLALRGSPPAEHPIEPSRVEVAPPVKPKAPEPALLSIVSEPQGAEVRIDGESHGDTPLDSLSLPSGRVVRLELVKAGYEPLAQALDLRAGPKKLTFTLTAKAAPRVMVHVESDPAGAQVSFHGAVVGTTPFDWSTEAASEAVELSFALAGFKAGKEQVVRAEGARIATKLVKQSRQSTPAADPSLEIKTGR